MIKPKKLQNTKKQRNLNRTLIYDKKITLFVSVIILLLLLVMGIFFFKSDNFVGQAGFSLGRGAQVSQKPTFQVVLVCGNGILDYREQCDDGNTNDGDGCSSQCYIETGTAFCGNGIVAGSEHCDDANIRNLDGCSRACRIETGYACTGRQPSVCTRLCGNRVIDPGETCELGISPFFQPGCTPGYGSSCNHCTFWCSIETISGPHCGDSQIDGSEQCDDGNTDNGDDCSSTCQFEPSACIQPSPYVQTIFWYPGDGNKRDYINSVQGSAVEVASGGIYGGVSYVPGKVAQAFNLPYRPVRLGNYLFNHHEGIVITAWVKLHTIGQFYQPILAKWDESTNQRVFALTVTPTGTVRFDTSSDGSFQPSNKVETTLRLTSNVWYHITAVHTNSGVNRIYVNGVPEANNQVGVPGLFSTSTPTYIGQSNRFAGSGQFLNGIVDEVIFFNGRNGGVLDDEEIRDMYLIDSAGLCKPVPPPLEQFSFSASFYPNQGEPLIFLSGREFSYQASGGSSPAICRLQAIDDLTKKTPVYYTGRAFTHGILDQAVFGFTDPQYFILTRAPRPSSYDNTPKVFSCADLFQSRIISLRNSRPGDSRERSIYGSDTYLSSVDVFCVKGATGPETATFRINLICDQGDLR